MELTTRTLPARKHIALVAHDHCKQMLMSWVNGINRYWNNTYCMQQALPVT